MPMCEKCWNDSAKSRCLGYGPTYEELTLQRDRDGTPCTPEEHAGPDATECPKCLRRACHQLCGICCACGYDPRPKR